MCNKLIVCILHIPECYYQIKKTASLAIASFLKLVNEFLQAPPRPQHTFDMGQLLEEMQQIDQQSFRQAPQRGVTRLGLGRPKYIHTHTHTKTSLYWAAHLSAPQLQMWQRWRSLVTGLPSFSPDRSPPPHLGSPLSVTQLMLTGRGSLSLRLQVADAYFMMFCLICLLPLIPIRLLSSEW